MKGGNNMKELLNSYFKTHKSNVYALNNWCKLNAKSFNVYDAFGCIYEYANGNLNKVTDIIEHLAAKKKVYGRTQVYSDGMHKKMDITYDGNGNLVLKGYENADQLPLKGQHMPKNANVFRKSDNQTSKIYQKEEERLYDIGFFVRQLFPTASNAFLAKVIAAVKVYAQTKKISPNKVLEGLKCGRLTFSFNNFRIVPSARESKTIVISSNTAQMITEELEMSEYKFYNNIKHFLKSLLEDPINTTVPLLLKKYGIIRSKLLKELLNLNIIEKEERINDKDENGGSKTATMMIKYRVPKKNFDKKLKKLYIKLFEKNLPARKLRTEDGATGCDASGQYSSPLFGVQRREMADIIEAATTSTCGGYQYTVPFPGDKETLARKNGVMGSVSVNKM